MTPERLLALAKITRPVTRYKTPVLYRLSKLLLKALAPKGRPGHSLQLVAPFDGGLIHVDTASSIEYHILFRGCHETAITDLVLDLVKPGWVCLDVGANVGAIALVMAKCVGPGGRIVALEPHPAMADRLESNIALNKYANIQVIRAALTEKDGTTEFFGFPSDAFQRGTSSLLPDDEATQKMTVATISGATLEAKARLAHVDFVKIDTEGAEPLILKTLDPILQRDRPIVIFEHRAQRWAKFGGDIRDVLGSFRSRNYELHLIHKNKVKPLQGDPPGECEILAKPR